MIRAAEVCEGFFEGGHRAGSYKKSIRLVTRLWTRVEAA